MRLIIAILGIFIISMPACEKSNVNVRNASITVLNYRMIDAFPKTEGGYYVLVKENSVADTFTVLDIDAAGSLISARPIGASSEVSANNFVDIQRLDESTASVLVQSEPDKQIQFVTITTDVPDAIPGAFASNPFSSDDWPRIESSGHLLIDGFYYVLSYLHDNQNDFSLGLSRFNLDGTIDQTFAPMTYYISQYNNNLGPEIIRFIGLSQGGMMVLTSGREGDHGGMIMRLENTGVERWRVYLQSAVANLSELGDIQQLQTDANIVQVLGSTSAGDVYLLKINATNGDVVEESLLPASGQVRAKSIQILEDGSQLISGDVLETGAGTNITSNIRVWKLDPSGVEVFSRSYGGGFDMRAVNAIQSSDSSILVIGGSTTFGLQQFSDVILIHTNERGVLN